MPIPFKMMPIPFDFFDTSARAIERSTLRLGVRLGAVAALLTLLPAGPALAQQAGSDLADAAHTAHSADQAASAASADQAVSDEATDRAGRVASLLELAATEYADAVTDGQVVNEAEYEETRAFTVEADRVFEPLVGPDAPDEAAVVTASVDSLASIVEIRGPAADFERHVRDATEALVSGWGAVPVPEPPSSPSAARGAELYRTSCAACHGASGSGDGPAAEGLEPPPTDFTAPGRTEEATPERDFQVITLGIPATEMAGYADLLDVQQRWDLVAYLQTLQRGQPSNP